MLAGGRAGKDYKRAAGDAALAAKATGKVAKLSKKAKALKAKAAAEKLKASRTGELVAKEVGRKRMVKVEKAAQNQMGDAKELASKMVQANIAQKQEKNVQLKITQFEKDRVGTKSKEVNAKRNMANLWTKKQQATLKWTAAKQAEDQATSALSNAQAAAFQQKRRAINSEAKP